MKKEIYFSDLLVAISLFFLINIPSIKLLYSSSIVNLIPLIGFVASIIIKGGVVTFAGKKAAIKSWSFFSIVLMFSFIWNFSDLTERSFNFIYLVAVVILAIVVMSSHSIHILSRLLIAWGIFIALWQLIVGVPYKTELGQNYLTVAMPLGALLTFGLFGVFSKVQVKLRAFCFFISAIAFLALSTLLSRGAVLLPILLLFVHFTLSIIYSKNIVKRFGFIVFIFLVVTTGIFLLQNIELRQLYRLEMLFNDIGNEPRVLVYSKALELISTAPIFGYGTGSSELFFNGTYPHNIFLDVLINGGLLLFISLLIILFLYFSKVLHQYHQVKYYRFFTFTELTLLSSSMYYFFQWNISWGLDSSYIPFVSVFAYIYFFRYNELDLKFHE